MRRVVWGGLLIMVAVPPATAQNEQALRTALEGSRVVVKLDLPASHKGVDLRFDREQPFDAAEHGKRLRDYDVALRDGDTASVTRVKVKDDLVEFHLEGGGFNWGTDSTTQTFTAESKSNHERELEQDIKNEKDASRKRELEDDLRDVRKDRERRDARRRLEVEEYNRLAHERDVERALRSGSRFNVRFKKRVAADALTPEGLLRYLSPWLEPAGEAEPALGTASGASQAPDPNAPGGLRKGLLRQEVEERLGQPTRQVRCDAGERFECARVTYAEGRTEIEAIFVEDVLVSFSVKPR